MANERAVHASSPASRAVSRAVLDGTVAAVASVGLGLYLAERRGLAPVATVALVAVGLALVVYTGGQVLARRPLRVGPADRVTLARAVLGGGCASIVLLAWWGEVASRTWWLLLCAVPAVALDAVDGAVARRTRTVTEAGADLDMRTDAAVLLILSLAVVSTVGAWVVAIGAMRYAFVAASWCRPALRARLPYRRSRRVIAGLQGVLLCVALAPPVPVWFAAAVTVVALVLLTFSFGRDVRYLERRARDGSGRGR